MSEQFLNTTANGLNFDIAPCEKHLDFDDKSRFIKMKTTPTQVSREFDSKNEKLNRCIKDVISLMAIFFVKFQFFLLTFYIVLWYNVYIHI